MNKYKHDGTDIADPHSVIKHNLLRDYLSDYIRTYFQNSKVRKLKIFVADLFSGGGIMRDAISKSIVFGSPLIVIDVCLQMQQELSNQRSYDIEIEPHFFFNDVDPEACKSLKNNIGNTFPNQRNCYFYNGGFEEILPQVLQKMKSLESFSGGNRKFFFLDPYSYSDISMASIRSVREAGKAEILWNFMVDHLSHYLSPDKGQLPDFYKLFNLNDEQIKKILKTIQPQKDEQNWHLIRHLLCKVIHERSGFFTMSDFAIQQQTTNKYMTMIHLADSPKARDVMTGAHWKHGTVTATYFHDGLKYEDIVHKKNTELGFFSFSELEHEELLERAEGEVYDLVSRDPGIPIDEVERKLANQYSALRRQDLDEIVFRQKKEVLWYDEYGDRTGNKKKIHRLQVNPQLNLFLK